LNQSLGIDQGPDATLCGKHKTSVLLPDVLFVLQRQIEPWKALVQLSPFALFFLFQDQGCFPASLEAGQGHRGGLLRTSSVVFIILQGKKAIDGIAMPRGSPCIGKKL